MDALTEVTDASEAAPTAAAEPAQQSEAASAVTDAAGSAADTADAPRPLINGAPALNWGLHGSGRAGRRLPSAGPADPDGPAGSDRSFDQAARPDDVSRAQDAPHQQDARHQQDPPHQQDARHPGDTGSGYHAAGSGSGDLRRGGPVGAGPGSADPMGTAHAIDAIDAIDLEADWVRPPEPGTGRRRRVATPGGGPALLRITAAVPPPGTPCDQQTAPGLPHPPAAVAAPCAAPGPAAVPAGPSAPAPDGAVPLQAAPRPLGAPALMAIPPKPGYAPHVPPALPAARAQPPTPGQFPTPGQPSTPRPYAAPRSSPALAAPTAPGGPAASGTADGPGTPTPGPGAGGGPVRPPRPSAGPERLTEAEAALVRETLACVQAVADRATAHFYALVFVRHPGLRQLFPVAMDVQRDRLFRALLDSARLAAEDPAALVEQLGRLGRGHRRYGVLPEHYPLVGECLIAALERYCGLRWSPAADRAWRRLYALVSAAMIAAAERDAASAPPWWSAEIVRVEHPASDVAVLTLRPDQPYSFRAGQYAPVETPWWPRVWRPYSFAAAPRPEAGTLVLHVRAVPAGWVSNALVRRAQPGDVVRLGAPAGDMVVDHAADRDLLCVGGGTGIAPLKAIAEEAAEHGRQAPLEVFYGARREEDLYAWADLHALERRHRWLTVRPVVDEPGAPGRCAHGRLPDVVGALGPWHTYDVLLSGPPAMVRRSLGTLLDAGVPEGRIRHDLSAFG